MTTKSTTTLPEARYTFGGDEFLFVEISEEMSLEANFRAMLIGRGLAEKKLDGIIELCPANASLLVRFDPDVIAPNSLETIIRDIEEGVVHSDTTTLETRIVEVPVWYSDPFTAEVVERFREGYHQDPSGTDLDYAAAVNELESAEAFIEAHHSSPWLVTMVGFVAGLPFMYQLVDREHQLQVPKYLTPRTDTPKLTIGHGGCFCALYSVRGAGGYQMFGVAAAPIFDPQQQGPDFADFMIFFKPGDIVKFRSIEEAEYYEIQEQVEQGTFSFKQTPVTFDLKRALDEGSAYNNVLMEALNVD
ncbi:5-oxoprolinase subunit B family protein [Brevibacterium sp. FME37]|uniref:5-oxoprolinase subunit B family protein n=1 Tax=Brevibacterium sp. FME37 TaxID=2742607 RepID=UPI00186658E9|nr:carboxyltransferase domain-containing protein [Brevibacterium sp. FME37]